MLIYIFQKFGLLSVLHPSAPVEFHSHPVPPIMWVGDKWLPSRGNPKQMSSCSYNHNVHLKNTDEPAVGALSSFILLNLFGLIGWPYMECIILALGYVYVLKERKKEFSSSYRRRMIYSCLLQEIISMHF